MPKPRTSSNPAFKNVDAIVAAQQNAAPTAAALQDMYNQPSYTPPPPRPRGT